MKPLVRLLDYEMMEVTDPDAIGQFAEVPPGPFQARIRLRRL